MTKARDIATSEVVSGEIGDTIQAHDDDLDSIAALDKTDGNVIVGDGTSWVAESGATVRTSLGLGTAATTDSSDYATAAQGTLADSALQSIGADAVDGTNIADDSIDSEHYVDGSIDTAHVADDAINAAKLNVTGNGTAGEFLQSDGDGTMTWAAAGGGFSTITNYNAPGTFNSTNVNVARVTVVGGGGGGAGGGQGGFGNSTQGGGGSGGGCAIEYVDLSNTNSVAVTRGAGGAAGNWKPNSNVGNNGGTGGTSSFGSFLSATGGQGGGVTRTVGGNGSGGQFNCRGGSGNHSGSDGAGNSGLGGGAGIPGKGPTNPTKNAIAGIRGGGSGGGHPHNTSGGYSTGAVGGPGTIIVEY